MASQKEKLGKAVTRLRSLREVRPRALSLETKTFGRWGGSPRSGRVLRRLLSCFFFCGINKLKLFLNGQRVKVCRTFGDVHMHCEMVCMLHDGGMAHIMHD